MDKQALIASLKKHGFSQRILEAFEKVKRENFIPVQYQKMAYEDMSLPIGKDQTISQPYTIATMLALLKVKENNKVLEIGSGSGYVLALLSEVVGAEGRAIGIERIPELAKQSKENLKDYQNVKVHNINGEHGFKEEAPYDRILISAAMNESPSLEIINQLKIGGILVAPIGPIFNQTLTSIKRNEDNYEIKEQLHGFVFVPFIKG